MQSKIIRQYYVLSFLFSVGGHSLICATYTTYLIQNGLNLFEVNLVNTIFYTSLFICEIPTGAFADIFGRKRAFVTASLLMALGHFVYGLSHTFFWFAVAEIIGAIASTFRSGAFQAWLVDNLKHHGYEGEFNKIFGRDNLNRQIGSGIGAIVGSYMASFGSYLPWTVSGILLLITGVIAQMTMTEEYFIKIRFSWRKGMSSMKSIATMSIRYGMEHKAIRFVLIATGIQILAVQPLNMYWQPFFRSHSVNDRHLGYVFAGIMLMQAIGAFMVSRMECKGREKITILRAQIAAGLTVVLASIFPQLMLALPLYLLHQIPRGCWLPLMDSYLKSTSPRAKGRQ
jgi:MFS family permease